MEFVYLFAAAIVFWCFLTLFMLHRKHGKVVYYSGTESLNGKTVLITGGSGVIGKNIAIDLSKRGARVIIASSNMQRGLQAVEDIQMESNNANVVWYFLDLSNLLSVRDFVSQIKSKEPKIHCLINNAGIGYVDTKRYRTKDGYDAVFLVNYLGHFLLTYLLIDIIVSSAPARIINISSIGHKYLSDSLKFTITDETVYGDVLFPYLNGYDASKLAMLLHVKELSRRYAEMGVTSYAVHPGIVANTGIWNMELFWPKCVSKLMRILMSLISIDGKSAAQTAIYCAVSKTLEGISGKYYERCQEAKEGDNALNEKHAQLLWHASLLLGGVKGNGNMVSCNYLEEQMKLERDTSSRGIYVPTPKPEDKMHPMQRA